MGAIWAVMPDEADQDDSDAILAALAAEYPVYAMADIDAMRDHIGALAGAVSAGQDQRLHIDAVFNVAHNVKGQGLSFGYDLMTVVGEALCEAVRDRAALTSADVQLVSAMVDACETVIAGRLTGDGGHQGSALLRQLGLVHAP